MPNGGPSARRARLEICARSGDDVPPACDRVSQEQLQLGALGIAVDALAFGSDREAIERVAEPRARVPAKIVAVAQLELVE